MRSAQLVSLWSVPALLAAGLSCPARADIPSWSQQTVGTSTQGSASVDSNGVWTIQGSGTDLWDAADEFHIVYQPLSGDGSITTKLLGTGSGDERAKAGVMMREDLDDPAAKIMTVDMLGADHGGEGLFRSLTGDRMGKDRKIAADGDAGLFPKQFPIWLKIERRLNGFTAYASKDGAFWIPVSRSQQIAMKSDITAGCFVCSHDDGNLLAATFDGSQTSVSGTLLKPEEAAPLQPNPIIALGGDNSVVLIWDRVNHLGKEADGYIVYRGKVGDVGDQNLVKIAELTGDTTSFVDDTIKNGEIARYRVTTIVKVGAAGDKVLESQTMTNRFYEVSGAPNPTLKIGANTYSANVLDCGGNHELTDKPGSAIVDANGVVTLTASGWDIQEEADGGEECMTPVTGDFTFTARVLGVPNHPDGSPGDEWAKFGIAVRETTMAESRYAAMLITPEHGIRSPHHRTFNGGRTNDVGPNQDTPDFPIYFRIQRRGETLSFFTSADGTTFDPYGSPETLDLPGLSPNTYVGFVGTAGGVQMPITQAKFDKVTLATP
jgi:hypothetical protein